MTPLPIKRSPMAHRHEQAAVAPFIPDDERLITIEDAAELRLAKPHVVSLEARSANVEGKGEVTVREPEQHMAEVASWRLLRGRTVEMTNPLRKRIQVVPRA
jgi:Type II/IV secretion system protein